MLSIRPEVKKRILDVTLCITALPIVLPLAVIIAAMVALSSRGPILYCADRVGRNMAPIRVYKFRTMVTNSTGPGLTRSGDPRITRVGRWLRATKLDELPQLLNVIMGDMSLVGPRPEDPKYVRSYNAEQRRVFSVPPGMTSLASIRFRHEQELMEKALKESEKAEPGNLENYYLREIMPAKLAIELDYVKARSTSGDVQILGQTVKALFS